MSRSAIKFQPFHEVGGDFLDFFTLTDGVIGIYLGDVRGKGPPAALYAALAVELCAAFIKRAPPTTVLSTVNRRVMLRGVSPRYAAVQLWVFRPAHGNFANRQRGNVGPADSFSARLP